MVDEEEREMKIGRVHREDIVKCKSIVRREMKFCEIVFKRDYVKKKSRLADWELVLKVLSSFEENYPALQKGLPLDFGGEDDG